MTRAFVSVGSNIDPAENVEKGLRLLARSVRVISLSTVYLTEAEGRPGQPPYYNCVVEIETELPAFELKQQVLRRIEAELGRVRGADKYASRTIDLDLILYDEVVLTTDELTLPDPDIMKRQFLAIPLQELAPDLMLPGSGRRLSELATTLPRDAMKTLDGYTKRLRKEILHER